MKKIVMLALISSLSLAIDNVQIVKKNKTSTYNEIDDGYKAERGFYFYEDTNNTKKRKIVQRCDCKKIIKTLDSIDKSLKTQTKIQEKILKILEERFDPKPKVIMVNGKKCVANSSAECFDMPLTPEAKRVPVLANLIKNPSLQTAARYLQWQAKYFKQIYRIGDSLPAAVTQFGAKAYPLNYKSSSYNVLNGFDPRDKATRIYLNKAIKENKLHFLVFFGINKDLDIIGVYGIKKRIETYPNVKVQAIFKTPKSEQIFKDIISILPANQKLKKIRTIIAPSKFKQLDIFTTPTILVLRNKKAQALLRGQLQVGLFSDKLWNYLEMNKLIDYKALTDYNSWKNQNFRQDYYLSTYGVNIDKELNKKQKGKK